MRPIIHSSLKKTVCMTFLEREMLIFKQFRGFSFSIAYRSGYYNTTNIKWILCKVKKLRDVLQEREGTSLNYLEVFLTISNNFFGPSISILLYLGLSWAIWEYLGLSHTISDNLGLSATIRDYLGLSGTIFDYLGQS